MPSKWDHAVCGLFCLVFKSSRKWVRFLTLDFKESTFLYHLKKNIIMISKVQLQRRVWVFYTEVKGHEWLQTQALDTGIPGPSRWGAGRAGRTERQAAGKRSESECILQTLALGSGTTHSANILLATPCSMPGTQSTCWHSLMLRGFSNFQSSEVSLHKGDSHHLPRRGLVLLTLPGGSGAGWLLPHHVGHAHI